jgi:hypothetical protein
VTSVMGRLAGENLRFCRGAVGPVALRSRKLGQMEAKFAVITESLGRAAWLREGRASWRSEAAGKRDNCAGSRCGRSRCGSPDSSVLAKLVVGEAATAMTQGTPTPPAARFSCQAGALAEASGRGRRLHRGGRTERRRYVAMLTATGSPRGERTSARSRSAGRGPARQAPEICASNRGLGGCPMLRAGARRASQWPGFA